MILLPANELPEAVDLRQPGRRAALTVRNAFGVQLEPTTENALRRISGARTSFGWHSAYGRKARLSADSESASSIEAVTRSIKEIVPDGRVNRWRRSCLRRHAAWRPCALFNASEYFSWVGNGVAGFRFAAVSSQVR